MNKIRLRYLAEVNPPTPEFDQLSDDDEVSFLPLETVWPGSRLDVSRTRPKAEVSSGYVRFKEGDILLPKVTPTFQAARSAIATGLLRSVGAGTTELHTLRARPGCDPRYVLYALHTKPFLTEGVSRFQGVAGLQRVPDDFVRSFEVVERSEPEQRRIADFLDDQVTRIDAAERISRRQVGLAADRLRSYVTERLVLSRTDTQWLPMRRVLAGIRTGSTPDVPDGITEEGLPWYSPASFGQLVELGDPVRHIPGDATNAKGVVRFLAGSVLIVGIGATAGRVTLLDHPACGNQQLTSLTTNDRLGAPLLMWQLYVRQAEIREVAPFTTLPILNGDFLKRLPVAVPPKGEQPALAREIDREASQARGVMSAAEKAISLWGERKRALITAAVTGEFDVSSASSRAAAVVAGE